MQFTLILTLALLAPAAEDSGSKQRQEPKDEKGFQPLFDGKTLDGWQGNLKMFRVQQGAIIGGTMKSKIPRNEFLTTTKSFRDFELRLQAKLEGTGANAGVQFRTKRIPNHHEVIGYQYDMGRQPTQNIWGA